MRQTFLDATTVRPLTGTTMCINGSLGGQGQACACMSGQTKQGVGAQNKDIEDNAGIT